MSSEAFPSLISELMSSKCDGDRLKTRTRFEEQCQVLNAKLDHLVKTRSQDLTDVVAYTSKAIETVSNSKAKCRVMKERLMSCQETLQCKRDDIRRLWSESLVHKHTYLLLEEIDKVKKIPAVVDENLLAKKYEEATRILVAAIELVEGKLSGIEALKELRVELHRLIDKLYAIFLEELIHELYMSTFHSVYQGNDDGSMKEVTYEKIFNYQPLKDISISINFNVSYVTVLLECMMMLGKISETLEILKEECQGELMKIVEKLSKLMYDIVQGSTDTAVLDLPDSQGQRFLADLLETIIGHFRQISINNKIFLHLLGKILASAGKEDSPVEVVDLYSNMQATLEQFVINYLELQPGTTLRRQSISVFTNSQGGSDLSAFFESKSHIDGKCQMLFKFRNSSQGLAGVRKRANYEHIQESGESQLSDIAVGMKFRKLALIYKPSLKNITVLFGPIKSFVTEIEKTFKVEPEMHCPLHIFIHDCANSFLDQVNSEINRTLETASLNLESWNVSTVPDNSPDGVKGSEKQILSSTLILNEKLNELMILLSKLPDYSNHFLQLMYYVTFDYKDLVHKAFKNLFDVEQNILSVSWAKDRDIRRLLKSFSNWKLLESSESGDTIESPEDIRMRNKEESELLIRNLHSEEHASWEIIQDRSILFNIAILQESLQWFSSQLLTIAKDFQPSTKDAEVSSELESVTAASGLQKMIKEYEDFSDVCLLALHLEVRAHCFHHLMQFEDVDIDICAANLAGDLNDIDDALYPALTQKELKYIFEGLGELVASILIHNVSNMGRASESFGKRVHRAVSVVHCCLANITMTREVSLERVRQYVRLLNLSSEEIVNEVLEEGPRFKEQEYSAVLRLVLGRKDAGSSHSLKECTEKLHKIFKRVSANVVS